jgi:hypothetical protein
LGRSVSFKRGLGEWLAADAARGEHCRATLPKVMHDCNTRA